METRFDGQAQAARDVGRGASSGRSARSFPGRRILRQGEPQDAFGFRRVRGTSNIIKGAGAKSAHVGVPIRKMREHDHRSSPGCGREYANRGPEGAIRQVITAQNELKRLLFDSGARVGEGSAHGGLATESAGNFFYLFTLKRIGRNDQSLAGVEQFPPPAGSTSASSKRGRIYLGQIILSGAAQANDSAQNLVKVEESAAPVGPCEAGCPVIRAMRNDQMRRTS